MIGSATNRVSGFFGDGAPTTDVTLGTALEVLRNERRRRVIRYVADFETDETVSVRDPAVWLTAQEDDVVPESLSQSDWKSAYVALIDGHLEKLAEPDVVTYDENAKMVGRGPTADVFADYLSDGEQYFTTGDAEC